MDEGSCVSVGFCSHTVCLWRSSEPFTPTDRLHSPAHLSCLFWDKVNPAGKHSLLFECFLQLLRWSQLRFKTNNNNKKPPAGLNPRRFVSNWSSRYFADVIIMIGLFCFLCLFPPSSTQHRSYSLTERHQPVIIRVNIRE